MTRRKITTPREPAGPKPERASGPAGAARDVRAAGNQAVQARLKVGEPGSGSEREADRASREVSRGATAAPAATRAEASARPAPESVTRTLAAPGRALPGPLRQEMERGFGRDFHDVRVHADVPARESAAAIDARAYTHRNDVVLGPGAPALTSAAGRQLLAHELAHVSQQHDGVVHRQTIASQVPAGIDLTELSASMTVPGNRQLTDDWNDASTTAPTQVTISLRRTGLTISFDPPILIDMQWPLSDLEWWSVTYDFATGNVTGVSLTGTQTLAAETPSFARGPITQMITTNLKGSRAATAGYDPLTDPNPGETVRQIQANIVKAPSGGSEVRKADVTNLSASVDVTFKSEIRQGDAQGMVVIPAGASATITADISGTLEDLSSRPTHPRLSAVHISSTGIVIQQGGEDVAKLTRLTVYRGGTVAVEGFEPLGKAATASAGETIVNAIGLIAILSSGTSTDRLAVAGREPHLEATVVPEMVRKKLEDALTKAVMVMLQAQIPSLPPGIDLDELFGITQAKTGSLGLGDFNLPSNGPGATAYG